MPHILADRLTIEFPLYHVGARSLKKRLMAASRLRQDDSNRIVVAALRDLSFAIAPGERVALVGNNGAGKTTLLRTLAGVYEPVGGRLEVAGSIGSLIDPSAGMDAESTGRENIVLRGLFRGMTEAECLGMADEVGAFSGLGEFLDVPVRTYSAGMSVRLAFAVATLMEPEILLMDEWFLAGDADFMHRARTRLEQLVHTADVLVLATHDMNIVRAWCTRAIRLEGGRIVADGSVAEVLGGPVGDMVAGLAIGAPAAPTPEPEPEPAPDGAEAPPAAPDWAAGQEAEAHRAVTATPPDYRRYHQARASTYRDWRGGRVLVIGCGRGADCAYFASSGAEQVVGVDIAQDIGADVSHPRIRYLQTSAESIPLDSGSFDLVFAYRSMQCVPDVAATYAEMARLARPGGVLYTATSPLWCARSGPHWGNAFDHSPWAHLRLDMDGILAAAAEARAAGRQSPYYEAGVLRRTLADPGPFNRRRAHEYTDACAALEGVTVLRNEIDQEPQAGVDKAVVAALIAKGYSTFDLFGVTHLFIGRKDG